MTWFGQHDDERRIFKFDVYSVCLVDLLVFSESYSQVQKSLGDFFLDLRELAMIKRAIAILAYAQDLFRDAVLETRRQLTILELLVDPPGYLKKFKIFAIIKGFLSFVVIQIFQKLRDQRVDRIGLVLTFSVHKGPEQVHQVVMDASLNKLFVTFLNLV